MTSMFWGLRLEAGKRYSTTVDKSFHVSMAALDCSSLKTDNEIVSVMLEEDEANVPYILCNLHKHKALQSRLDLNFMTGDRVTFFCRGNGVVHLSGYIVPDDDEFSDPDMNEDMEEECEEEESNEMETSKLTPANKSKGKVNGLQSSEKRKADGVSLQDQKKKKIVKADFEEDSDEEDDDDDEEEEEEEKLVEDILYNSDVGNEESEESDEDEESDEEEEESDEGETQAPSLQKKKGKKKGQEEQQQPQQQKTPNNKQTPGKGQKTPNGLPTSQQQSGKKEKKKGGETPRDTPKANKSMNEETSPQKKTLEGGVTVKDLKIGNGLVCKTGKMATVYYVGKLKSNNKVFDSTTQGPGFKFRVGRGEVIKGWDVGLVGMKVGGKRLVICPPHMGYGQKGSPPSIPPNSALIFEVELKGVN